MKYCPHCGAEYLVGTVSLCPVCGKSLPNPEASAEKKQKSKRWRKKNKPVEYSENKIMPECQDDPKDTGYDGYYNDVMPRTGIRSRKVLTKTLSETSSH